MDVNLCARMNETNRLPEFVDKEEPHPSSKLKLWMGPENLGASHSR